jgi:hypothetical protein
MPAQGKRAKPDVVTRIADFYPVVFYLSTNLFRRTLVEYMT